MIIPNAAAIPAKADGRRGMLSDGVRKGAFYSTRSFSTRFHGSPLLPGQRLEVETMVRRVTECRRGTDVHFMKNYLIGV